MRPMIVIGLCVVCNLATVSQPSAQVEQCVRERIARMEDRAPIENTGSVECPSADLVDFPPRERRHNRESRVCIEAPAGRTLVTDRADAVRYDTLSDNDGSAGQVAIEGETRACVPISCRGAGLTEGRRWMEVRVMGQTKRAITQNEIISITLACARDNN